MTQSTSKFQELQARRRGQAGSSLMVALAIVAVMTIIVTVLVGYLATSQKADFAYRKTQDATYASDGAMKAAINWAKQYDIGRDPSGYTADPACVYRDPESSITVTCAAVAGQDSGMSEESGLVPPNAITLLGQRYGELPLYSPCTGANRTDVGAREVGLLIDAKRATNSGSSVSCTTGTSPIFVVGGKIRSNAPIRSNGGRLELSGTGADVKAGTSPLYNNTPCIGPFSNAFLAKCSTLDLQSGGNRGTPPGSTTNPFDPKEALEVDPARADQTATKAQYRIGDINWNAGRVSINGSTPADLTGTTSLAGCTNTTSDIVRFYPGIYRDAEALNRVFASNCANGVFWFSPAKNAAQRTTAVGANYDMAAGAQQGVFVFDFQNTTGSNCGALTDPSNANHNPHRWCLGTNTSSLVVGGWPSQWNPGSLGTGSTATTATVDLQYAATVEDNGSKTWSSQSNARQADANDATYNPPRLLGIALPSNDRSMTLRQFATSSTGSAPVAVSSNTDVTITVTHREQRSSKLNAPAVEVSTLDDAGLTYYCGKFPVPKSVDSTSAAARVASRISTVDAQNDSTATNAQRQRLKDCFSSPDRVANARLTWLVTGDELNSGGSEFCIFGWCFPVPSTDPPQLALDGMKVSLTTPTGGWFGANVPAPATYCDATKAGVQFVFGGDSTVHVGSNSLQLCAGPPPSPANPDEFQQIAVWGMPQNYLATDSGSAQPNLSRVGKAGSTSLLPTSVSTSWVCDAAGEFGNWIATRGSVSNKDYSLRAGEAYTNPGASGSPVAASVKTGACVTIVLPRSTTSTLDYTGFGDLTANGSCNRDTDLCFDSAAQAVSKVELKVGYSTACGSFLGFNLFCTGSAAKGSYEILSTAGTSLCSGNDAFPATSTVGWYAVDVTSCLNTVGKINDARVRIKLGCNVCVNTTKTVEGVELVVTTKPASGTVNAVTPATGCRIGLSGYGSGFGDNTAASSQNAYENAVRGSDCALISGGRVNIQGTLYAPSDAVEVNDTDAIYPFASRGIIARHLRVRQYQRRAGFGGTTVTNVIDNTRNPRQMTFTGCIREVASNEACGTKTGDKVMSRALVAYESNPAYVPPTGETASVTSAKRLTVPRVISFTNQVP